MMKEAGRRKENLLPGYLGGTLRKFGNGDEDVLPWTTTFAGRPANNVNGTIGGTQYGGGFDPFEGLAGGLEIVGNRIIPTMQQARRRTGATPDSMPAGAKAQANASAVGEMDFSNGYANRNRTASMSPDAMPTESRTQTAGLPVGQMDFSYSRGNAANHAATSPDLMPLHNVAQKGSAAVPEMSFYNQDQLRSAGKQPNNGSKRPGLFGKIKGVLGGLGGNIDLGNIVQLANAYSIAAQRDARAEGLRAPKSFVANPYEQDALQQLNKLHSDYYPVWAMNRELEGRGKSSIMQSGGLSAGQKMLGYMGLTNQTQQNNASALFEHQGRENALRSQAAKASLEAGNQSATRQQQAYQWDEDMLAKAHAAQENMLETSAYDRQNGLTQFFKNLWEKNQFDRTMNLYESQQKDDRAKTQAIIENLRNNKPSETPKPEKTPIKAAEEVVAGAEKPAKQIVQPEAKWDGQLLSRKRKSNGENVANLQRNLAKVLGQDKINSIMSRRGLKGKWDDGKFGGATEEALMEFQKSQGWKNRKEGLDGIFGGDTFKAL